MKLCLAHHAVELHKIRHGKLHFALRSPRR
jgi:hypothetical protein